MGYTKLFSSIVHSTVWRAPDHVRLVWVTMLALANEDGDVEASIPGLADAARVSLEECEGALEILKSPDPYSRTKDHEGRRIQDVPGGWHLFNHGAYRDKMSTDEQRAKAAERQRRRRERLRAKSGKQPVTRDVTLSHASSRSVTPVTTTEQNTTEQTKTGEEPPVVPLGTKPKKPRAAKWTRVPPDWQPNDAHRELAAKLGIDLDTERAKFADYEFGRPKTDADAAFRNWLRRAGESPGRFNGNAPKPRQPNSGWDFSQYVDGGEA